MRFPINPGRLFLTAIILVGMATPALAQNQQQAAQLAVRIQQLEEQIRLLTGQVEGLQFQLTQMQTMLENQVQDNEFRFQQLEGGAAPASQGSISQDRLPADPSTTASLPEVQPLDLTDADQPMDGGFADSRDPLLNGGVDQLGSLEGRPLDLNLNGGSEISSGDATAQFEAGKEAIMRGDYAFAEDQFQQFVDLYPDDPRAADATNYLGEALMQRGAFDDAALVLAEGYQKFENTERAPDLMLRLGIALNGAGESEVACRTFFTLEKRYPSLPAAFTQRLGSEKSKANCPV